ncbi:MAG: hypothetical protein HY812_12475 [Planctomycetes bacterium]|nr:hypothetical protein [Planctomycetota bacterium]
MKRTAFTVLAALAVSLISAPKAQAFASGTFTITGENTEFQITVSAPDSQGNQTVTVNDGGKMLASRIKSVTPNSFRTSEEKYCMYMEFTVVTADAGTFTVELSPNSGEVTNHDQTDSVGCFRTAGTSARRRDLFG